MSSFFGLKIFDLFRAPPEPEYLLPAPPRRLVRFSGTTVGAHPDTFSATDGAPAKHHLEIILLREPVVPEREAVPTLTNATGRLRAATAAYDEYRESHSVGVTETVDKLSAYVRAAQANLDAQSASVTKFYDDVLAQLRPLSSTLMRAENTRQVARALYTFDRVVKNVQDTLGKDLRSLRFRRREGEDLAHFVDWAARMESQNQLPVLVPAPLSGQQGLLVKNYAQLQNLTTLQNNIVITVENLFTKLTVYIREPKWDEARPVENELAALRQRLGYKLRKIRGEAIARGLADLQHRRLTISASPRDARSPTLFCSDP